MMMKRLDIPRNTTIACAVTALLVAVFLACGGGGGSDGGDKDVAAGQRLYMANCGLCHGQSAEGKPKLGKGLHDNEFVNSLTDEDLLAFLREGRRANHPLNTRGVDMPPRGGNPGLTDDDLRQIVAYLRSLS
jgi:mono/diheme cytochrome c family protein